MEVIYNIKDSDGYVTGGKLINENGKLKWKLGQAYNKDVPTISINNSFPEYSYSLLALRYIDEVAIDFQEEHLVESYLDPENIPEDKQVRSPLFFQASGIF